MDAKSKHSLDDEIITIQRGLAIYKVKASPYWMARVWDSRTKRYTVRSTKETSRIKARVAAKELADDILGHEKKVERQHTFRHYANELLKKSEGMVSQGELNANYVRTTRHFLENKEWGLNKTLGNRDVRELRTKDYQDVMTKLAKDRPDMSPSTRNMLTAAFRNVLKMARDDGVIDAIPATPRAKQQDRPRAYFPFHPLVSRKDDVFKRILTKTRTLVRKESTCQ